MILSPHFVQYGRQHLVYQIIESISVPYLVQLPKAIFLHCHRFLNQVEEGIVWGVLLHLKNYEGIVFESNNCWIELIHSSWWIYIVCIDTYWFQRSYKNCWNMEKLAPPATTCSIWTCPSWWKWFVSVLFCFKHRLSKQIHSGWRHMQSNVLDLTNVSLGDLISGWLHVINMV